MLSISKSHANDAYAMGSMHPKKRTRTEYFRKCRRNNRILEKFYDAQYVGLRDGETKSGPELSCGRTSRREPRHSEKSERVFRARRAEKRRKNGGTAGESAAYADSVARIVREILYGSAESGM